MKNKAWSWGKADTLPDKDMRCERCGSSIKYFKVATARRLGKPVLCTDCLVKLKR